MSEEVRLQKYLADCGVASRRKAEELILASEISVNEEIVNTLGVKVDPKRDIVTYKGREVKPSTQSVYIMLNKPIGYITTASDQFDRPTVMDLIKDQTERLFPVGRLDYDTSGLLLLTNDGELTYKLTHPSKKIPKVYIAKIFGTPTPEAINRLRRGVEIDGYTTAPAKVDIMNIAERYSTIKITITEGKNRQVRKMCEAIGSKVASLTRIAIGTLFLGQLKKGEYRKLTPQEIGYLKKL